MPRYSSRDVSRCLPPCATLSSRPIVLKSTFSCPKSLPLSLPSSKMHISVTLITLIAVYFVPRVSSGDQCFNIGQVQVGIDSVGADYLPCQPSASSSSCCPLGWICLSNGLCEPLPGNSTQNHGLTSLYTGFCTDPSWKNETVCPRVCNNNVTRKKPPRH